MKMPTSTPLANVRCSPLSMSIVMEALVGFAGSSGVNASIQRYQAAFLFCAVTSAATFVVSSLTGNYSQVDKLWSILPVMYAWIPVAIGGEEDDNIRTLVMALLATLWGIRLTFNFYRRGGYCWPPWRGDEDYRWAYIQQGHFLKALAKPVAWVAFNLLFISIYQNVLLMLIAMPSFVVADFTSRSECRDSVAPFEWIGIDGVLVAIFLCLIAIETTADNQQWQFQADKTKRKARGELGVPEFCKSGLFAIVRKPNYSAEQAIWICNYFFSVSAIRERSLINWSICGCFLLVLLFQGSGWFTEMLSMRKYPTYASYKEQVPLYVPSISSLRNALVGKEIQIKVD